MKHQGLLTGLGVICLLLSGCSQDHPGNMSLQRVEVHQDQFEQELYISDFTPETAQGIAQHYLRYGDQAPLSISVQYDPTSATNSAVAASHKAAKITETFRKAGVATVKTDILPVRDLGETARLLITYDQVSALAPDCGQMPGLDNTKTDWKAVEEYGFGCSVEANIARQIARPRDLLGNEAGLPADYDGRRVTNIIENHRTGTPNEPLQGETASEE